MRKPRYTGARSRKTKAGESTWRNYAAPIIAKVIADVGTADKKRLKKALHDAYPFGERKYHPYRIWLDEIRQQLGIPKRRTAADNDDQQTLFDA